MKKGIFIIITLLIFAFFSNGCNTSRENPNDPNSDNYTPRQVNPPVITPNGQDFSSPIDITFTTSDGSDIIFTTDNTEPSATNGTMVATGTQITLTETTIVRAIACKEYYDDSTVVTETFTYIPPAPASVSSISVAPNSLALTKTETRQLTATAHFDNNTTTNITNQVAWSSNNSSIATVSASGVVTANAPGIATITASYTVGGRAFTANSTITIDKVLTSFEITPTSPTINNLTTVQFSSSAAYDDGSTPDVTGSTAWTVSCIPSGGASITPSEGLLTAAKGGSCTVTATYGTEVRTAAVTINPVWQVVGGAGLTGSTALASNMQPSISVYNDNEVYVAFNDSTNVRVYKYNGTAWSTTGINKTTDSDISLFVYNNSGSAIPYVAYGAGTLGLSIDSYNGTTWTTYKSNINNNDHAYNPSLYVYNNSGPLPYVIIKDMYQSNRASVFEVTSGGSSPYPTLGLSLPTGAGETADFTSLDVYNGTPYIAYRGNVGVTNYCYAKKWDSSEWDNMNDSNTVSGSSFAVDSAQQNMQNIKIKVSSGTPYVAYITSSNTVNVYKWETAAWTNISGTMNNAACGPTTSLGFIIRGSTLYIAYYNTNDSQIYVYQNKQDVNGWQAIGSTSAYLKNIEYVFSLDVYNDAPYVFYRDKSASTVYAGTVIKFD